MVGATHCTHLRYLEETKEKEEQDGTPGVDRMVINSAPTAAGMGPDGASSEQDGFMKSMEQDALEVGPPP